MTVDEGGILRLESSGVTVRLTIADVFGQMSHADISRLIVALTDAQIEMMRLIAAGYSNAEIAKRMWITEDGVNRAVTRVVKQLGLQVDKEHNTRVLISRAYAGLAGRTVPGE